MIIDNISHQDVKIIHDLDTNSSRKENSFLNYIKTALEEISNNQHHENTETKKFILNESGVSLNDVMINIEKSAISIQMAIQIRNKITSAYQEIMSQQV
ncbi:flagellar hook-basal body complex protein FliE [Buchnera aphidicola (Uroleucon sonchi)]|uniref:Flagellar hook-basal body complex protein FliE n=2 Tax=Buchnera aphidicola TaxID=9 RepID=A0A6C1FIQ5_BUCUN|nr:flagellar hook-basal body complex protein FliE [Buchnera aphidicola (Uroleucon sonchi)]